jgi:alpha/beta superfamily hydrolase
MPTERFQFTSSEGHQLAASLDLPEREPLAYALFAHCFTCGKDVLAARRIAVALAAKGIAVLRFDFTGLGSSENSGRQGRRHHRSPFRSRPRHRPVQGPY